MLAARSTVLASVPHPGVPGSQVPLFSGVLGLRDLVMGDTPPLSFVLGCLWEQTLSFLLFPRQYCSLPSHFYTPLIAVLNFFLK